MLRILLLVFSFLPLLALGQKAKLQPPTGLFEADSIKIGEPVAFIFYLKHKSDQEVLFPDSTYNFAPFEFVSKRFFFTRSAGGWSHDSAVYMLRSFSVQPVQSLSLPVYVLDNRDTLRVYSRREEVYLQQQVTGPPDPLQLRAHTRLAPIEKRLNLAYWLIGAGVVMLLFLLVWMIFGKQLIIRYRLYVLRKHHNLFISRYNAYIDQFNRSESLHTIEQAITLWKNYLTKLEGNAINSFTTREIAAFYDEDEDVSTALRLFDKAIYGNIVSDKSSETIIAFYLLHHFADRRYEFIKDQTRNVPNPEILPQLA
ncbi:MAG: hypothetical protein ACO1O1_10730 [Adhaeribacter sp.]